MLEESLNAVGGPITTPVKETVMRHAELVTHVEAHESDVRAEP